MQRVWPWLLLFSLALAQNLRLELAPGSEARYRVREQLVGVNFPNDAVGTTRTLSGGVVLGADGRVASGRFTVNLASLQSDEARRDNFIRRNTLQTDRFPEAVFVPKEVRGLRLPLRPGDKARVEIVGDLTIREVTRSVTWLGEYEVTPEGVRLQANTRFRFEDFRLTQPRVAVVLSVENEIRLEVDFLLKSP